MSQTRCGQCGHLPERCHHTGKPPQVPAPQPPGQDGGTQPDDDLMTPAEVAQRFRVDPKTVTRWAEDGKITSIRTPGGHRRYRRSEVEDIARPTQRRPPK